VGRRPHNEIVLADEAHIAWPEPLLEGAHAVGAIVAPVDAAEVAEGAAPRMAQRMPAQYTATEGSIWRKAGSAAANWPQPPAPQVTNHAPAMIRPSCSETKSRPSPSPSFQASRNWCLTFRDPW
jgi:hypothetical protein